MAHHKIFSTNLFVLNDFYKGDTEPMKKYISELWTKRDYDNNWQTKSANLHKQKEFPLYCATSKLLPLNGVLN